MACPGTYPGKMLEELWEFDCKMIHEKYQNIMGQMGAKVKRWWGIHR